MYNFWTLVRFEYKKLFKKKAVWLLLPLLMTFSVLSVVVPSFSASISNSETGQTCTMYEMQQTQRRESSAIKGRLIDDSLLQEMRIALDSDKILGNGLPASIRYDGIRSFILSSVGDFLKIEDGSQFTGSADELYALRAEAIKENWAEDGLTKGEKQFLSEKEDSLEIPFSYGYSGSYDMIASSMITVSAMLSFLIAVCLSSVFSSEHTGKTDQLILCSRFGKAPVYFAKLFTGITFSLAASLVMLLSVIVPSFLMYGTEGSDVPIQVLVSLASWDMTMGEAVLILSGLCLTASVLQCCAALFFSERFKSGIPAMGILLGVLLLTGFLNIPDSYRIASQIWEFMPLNLVSPGGTIHNDRLVPFFGTYLTSWQAGPILYLLLCILLLAAGYRVYSRWQAGGR